MFDQAALGLELVARLVLGQWPTHSARDEVEHDFLNHGGVLAGLREVRRQFEQDRPTDAVGHLVGLLHDRLHPFLQGRQDVDLGMRPRGPLRRQHNPLPLLVGLDVRQLALGGEELAHIRDRLADLDRVL